MRDAGVCRDEKLCVIGFSAEDCRFHFRSFRAELHS
jgi:hypothetical protein